MSEPEGSRVVGAHSFHIGSSKGGTKSAAESGSVVPVSVVDDVEASASAELASMCSDD